MMGAEIVEVPLSPLQRIVGEILDPLAFGHRTTKDWRRLYRSFFGFFATGGQADEVERKAWETAFGAFNRNLVAIQNRVVQVVPMTFQDILDAGASVLMEGKAGIEAEDIPQV
jgi:hypothetical protein